MPCPFTNPANLINPQAMFKSLRDERPVYFDDTIGAYIVSRHEDVNAVFKQPNLYSSALALFASYNYEDVVNGILNEKAYGAFQSILPMTDPPEHTRIRSALNLAFSSKRVAQFQVYIEEVIDELITAFIDDGEFEVMSQLAVPLPVSIIAHLLSVPRERSADIKRWTQSYTACAGNRISSEDEAIKVGNDLAEMQQYIIGHINERRDSDQDDVLTDIIKAEVDGKRLTDPEILAVAAAFLVAGHETGSVVITSIIKTLAEDPGLVEFLRAADERAYKVFIEEILRKNPPVRMLPRVTTQDTELRGVAIPAGSQVLIMMGAANEDEAVFGDNAGELQADRRNANRHLSFGAGPHICIGNMLARTELKSLLEAIVSRMDNIKLVNPDIPMSDYSPVVLDLNLHLHKLQVSFDKRSA